MNFAKKAAAKMGEAQKAIAAKAAELDEQYKISEKAGEAKAQAKAKAAAIDAKTGASQKAAAASASIRAKAAAIDEQYHVSEKAAATTAAAKAKVLEADSKMGVSAKVSSMAKTADGMARTADEKTGLSRRAAAAGAVVSSVTGELNQSYVTALADMPGVPTADELMAYGDCPGPCKVTEPLTPEAGKVCVTGASGFIAMHLVSQLLREGYEVVATVRSPARIAAVAALGEPFPGKLTIVEGANLMIPGTFALAIQGCVGVYHTASPFYPAQDRGAGVSVAGYEELVVPAVLGTREVLSACQAAGTVRRVVVTASFACILNPGNPDYPADCTYSESVWNVSSLPTEENVWTQEGAGMHAYRYSKIMAEVEAWNTARREETTFDLCTINPPLVIGTNLAPVSSPAELNESSQLVYKWLTAGVTLPPNSMAFVDVKDVAAAHVLAMTTPTAGGKRFLTTAPAMLWSEVATALATSCPADTLGARLASAPPAETDRRLSWTLDTSKLTELGMTFTPATAAIEAQVASLLAQFPALGPIESLVAAPAPLPAPAPAPVTELETVQLAD
eukprot:SAG25_NODE_680_length_5962_cov_2.624936_1_plen_563_part_00